jgi:hypothetical protein
MRHHWPPFESSRFTEVKFIWSAALPQYRLLKIHHTRVHFEALHLNASIITRRFAFVKSAPLPAPVHRHRRRHSHRQRLGKANGKAAH